jgi:hypothetical protein
MSAIAPIHATRLASAKALSAVTTAAIARISARFISSLKWSLHASGEERLDGTGSAPGAAGWADDPQDSQQRQHHQCKSNNNHNPAISHAAVTKQWGGCPKWTNRISRARGGSQGPGRRGRLNQVADKCRLLTLRVILHARDNQVALGGEADIKWQSKPTAHKPTTKKGMAGKVMVMEAAASGGPA